VGIPQNALHPAQKLLAAFFVRCFYLSSRQCPPHHSPKSTRKTKSGDIKKLTADEFDELADSGQDMSDYLDWDKAVRGDSKRINIDLPTDFLAGLDREAARRGITRQSLIKVWLYDRLKNESSSNVLSTK
jgi:CopG antitoxin of type II toxin-antitoxin system